MLPDFWKKSSPRRKRIISVAVFLLLWLAVTLAGVMTPLSQQDADSLNQELDQLRQNASAESIFGHNLMICLVMFVPIGGPIFAFLSSYSSGVVMAAQAMSVQAHGIAPLLVFFAYLLIPIYWLETISICIGLSESVWLIRRGLQGFGKREVRNAAVLIAIVTLILLMSAIIEMAMLGVIGG